MPTATSRCAAVARRSLLKTELKNINSFKNLHDGLAYEICRQAEVLESGGVIRQETRHWEPGAKRTIVMRVKETADDLPHVPGTRPRALRPLG